MKELNNRLHGGMNRDFSTVNQPENTYRSSLNGDIYEIGKDKFEWRPINGPAHQFTVSTGMQPYSFIDLVTKLVIFSVDDYGRGEIGYISFIPPRKEIYTKIYYHHDLNFNKNYIIKGKGYKENNTKQKIFWRDDPNPPRTLDFSTLINTEAEPYFTTLLAGKSYLYLGETYLRYTGMDSAQWVAYPGDMVRPLTDLPIDPNDHKCVLYIPVNMLEWTPQSIGGKFEYVSLISGSLLYGSYFISFRLGLNSGFVTPWANILGPINILNFANNLFQSNPIPNPHESYQQTQGKSHLLPSIFGFRLQFTDVDTSYDFVELLVLHCDQKDIIEQPYIGLRQEINGQADFIVDVQYNHKFGLTSIPEILEKNISILNVSDLDILKKQLNVINVTESPELSIGEKIEDVVIREEIVTFAADVLEGSFGVSHPGVTENAMQSAVIERAGNGNPSYIRYGQLYQVQGTSGYIKITPTQHIYYVGSYIVQETGTYISTGDARAVPVFRVRKYFNRSSLTSVYDIHELQCFMDYKDPVLALYGKGYWGWQTYRIGALFYDTRMNPMFVRYLGDKTTSQRNILSSIQSQYASTHVMGEYSNGVFNGALVDGSLLSKSDHDAAGKILSLVIDNLDLTDIIDEIGGFSIVRAPREKTIISEGFIEPTVYQPYINQEGPHAIDTERWRPNSIAYHQEVQPVPPYYTLSKRHGFWYCMVDPDKLFGKDPYNVFVEDDYIRIIRYMENQVPVNEVITTDTHNVFRKLYTEKASMPAGATPMYSEAKVLYNSKAEISGTDTIYFDPAEGANTFRNVMHARRGNENGIWDIYEEIFYVGVGGPCHVIKTDADGDPNYGFGYWPHNYPNHTEVAYVPVVQHMRSGSTAYGGEGTFSLGQTTYFHVGHFQLIDDDFKNAIRKTINGETHYVVDGIQIFGGDCFVNIFDYKRKMLNEYVYYQMRDHAGSELHSCDRGETLFVPLQTSSNVATRIGRHIAMKRSYFKGVMENGIKYNTDELILSTETWEEFMLDDSYDSEGSSLIFPGYPYGLDTNNIFTERIRYTPKKIDGEFYDSFRIFKSNSYIDLNKDGGIGVTIIGQRDRLFYWQYLCCGYIPIEERAMQSNALGTYVQLGVGGRYERIDDISKFFGVQGRFAVTKIEDGFMFLDGIRKAFVHLSYESGLQNEGIIKGMDNDFNNYINDTMPYADNPFYGEGIYIFFAPSEHRVYLYLKKTATTAVGVIYNTVLKKFTSFYDWNPKGMGTILNKFILCYNDEKIYVGGAGSVNQFFGMVTESYVEIIVNQMPDIIKCFLMGEAYPMQMMFGRIEYRTESQTYLDTYTSSNENYESRLGEKWRFNFPITSTGRLYGLYLSVKFVKTGISSLISKISVLKTYITEWL